MEAGHCVVVRRDTGAKETVRLDALTQRAAGDVRGDAGGHAGARRSGATRAW